MMHNLLLEEGDIIQIESVSLPVATFSKFQPQSPDFLDITNPKAVLENALRNFACLTNGDLIAIKYNSKVYELCVLETRPGNAVTIIECDMNVSFHKTTNTHTHTHQNINVCFYRWNSMRPLATKNQKFRERPKNRLPTKQCTPWTHRTLLRLPVKETVSMEKRKKSKKSKPIIFQR